MPKIKKTKLRNFKFPKFLTVLFVVMCLTLCVFVANFFSSTLVVGSFQNNSQSKDLSYTIYAVSVGKFPTTTLAKEFADSVKFKNGAGYIFEKDGSQHVLASAYEKENDAKKVVENLSKSYNPEIIEIIIPEANFSSKEIKEHYFPVLKTFKTTFLKLYDISIALDTKVYTESKAKILISEIKTEIMENQDNLKDNIISGTSTTYLKIKLKTNNLIDLLTELVLYNDNTCTLSSKIKFCYIQALDLNIELVQDLSEK